MPHNCHWYCLFLQERGNIARQGINILLDLAVYRGCTKANLSLGWEGRETNDYFYSCSVSAWLQFPCLQLALVWWLVCIASRSPLEHNRVLFVCTLLRAALSQQRKAEIQTFPETAAYSQGERGCNKKQTTMLGDRKRKAIVFNQAFLT